MRLKEQRLWDAMRKAAPKGVWLQRVENIVVDGMPDVYAVETEGGACWVELKAPVRPKRAQAGGLDPVRRLPRRADRQRLL